jgi:hypothetical protein
MESSWCKSSPAKTVAGRPVARVAPASGDRWGEAYTARKRAARIQLRNRFVVSVPTWLAWRKAASGRALGEFVPGPTESPARGRLSKGFPRNLGQLPISSREPAVVHPPQTNRAQGAQMRPRGSEVRHPTAEVPGRQGRPEAVGMGREQSYDPIAPMKVGKRRASATGRPRYPLEGRGNKPTHRLVEPCRYSDSEKPCSPNPTE